MQARLQDLALAQLLPNETKKKFRVIFRNEMKTILQILTD